MLSLDTLKVALEIAQMALGGIFVFGLWSLKAGRWIERHDHPLSVVPPKTNGNGEWRSALEAVKMDLVTLRADVDAATRRRDDLSDENRRDHKRFDDSLAAITRRIDNYLAEGE